MVPAHIAQGRIRRILLSCTDSVMTDLPPAAGLIALSVFGVKAVTRDTEGRLAVDDGGLGESSPLGDPPAVMICTS